MGVFPTTAPSEGREVYSRSWAHPGEMIALHPNHRAFVGVLLALATATAAGSPLQLEPRVVVAARAVQPGEVVRLDVTCPCADGPPRVTAFDRDVPLIATSRPSSEALFLGFFGIDLDTPPGIYAITVHDPERRLPDRSTELRVVAKAFRTRQLSVAPAFVDPSATDLERITRDAAKLNTLLARVTPRIWDGPFVAPVATPATSNFGTRSVFNGQPRAPHAGVDFSGSVGTPVVAPAAGRVVMAEDLFFTGNTVLIDHGLGLFSLLAHLSTMTVAEGDGVERGAPLGQVGATGRVTGPHLHWAIRFNGARVDPLSLIFATAAERTTAGPAGTPASAPRRGAR